jgi:hypothetical protein
MDMVKILRNFFADPKTKHPTGVFLEKFPVIVAADSPAAQTVCGGRAMIVALAPCADNRWPPVRSDE